MMTEEILTSDECAKLLRCTTAQIEELARGGEIPGLKFGHWIFVRADLLTFLAEKARAEAAERRARCGAPYAPAAIIKPRRSVPPELPVIATAQPPTPTQVEPHDLRLLLTADEAAEMLSIAKSTLWREVREGNIPKPIKIGSVTRWRRADLERLVAGLSQAKGQSSKLQL